MIDFERIFDDLGWIFAWFLMILRLIVEWIFVGCLIFDYIFSNDFGDVELRFSNKFVRFIRAFSVVRCH